jgi:hypothetical protein
MKSLVVLHVLDIVSGYFPKITKYHVPCQNYLICLLKMYKIEYEKVIELTFFLDFGIFHANYGWTSISVTIDKVDKLCRIIFP